MAHTVLYPAQNFLYLIGNTSAVVLTDTLAPEEPANLLLLGCGDLRNVLFALYNQADGTKRPLDFTCCDVEPAVLARNVLLLTMITDNELSDDMLSNIWNSFFHFFLDEKSHSFLIAQCQSLINVSESITTWNDSEYKFIRMCNVNTLLELRRHWELYVQAGQLSSAGKERLREMVLSSIKTTKVTKHKRFDLYPCRSAGPYFIHSTEPASQVFQHFWKTGITSLNPQDVSAATLVNPTFVYSLAGEGFALHYGTTPILPFHLAPAFLDSKQEIPTMAELVSYAKSQFFAWVKHFRTFVKDKLGQPITIRFFAGDALFFCRALAHHIGTEKIPSNLPVAPWNATPLVLDGGDYGHSGGAPTSFNVIETSNIMDHIGLLNVLIAVVPLLSPIPSATLFTEALLYTGEDATKSFTIQFCADVSTMGLLLDLAPINYLSNFNTRSNAEEIMAAKFQMAFKQYHERITWKRPSTGDSIIASQPDRSIRIPISFEPQNLGNLLFNIYLKIFVSDDTMSLLSGTLQSLEDSEKVHYTREAFAVFLAIVKRRVNVNWDSTMASFFDRLDTDKTLTMGMSNCQDLSTHLHLAGVYDAESMRGPLTEGRFLGWTQVPPTVSVILVVPRDRLRVLSDADPNQIGTPILHGNLRGRTTHNIFASMRVGFGTVTSSGTDARPGVVFEPDPSSWAGTSPLIVSFSVPSSVLHIESPDVMSVTLSLRSTPRMSKMFISKLGMSLEIFAAPLMDRSQVFVVPEEPQRLDESLDKIFSTDNHQENPVCVATDPQDRRATTLTARANITDAPARDVLSSGAKVSCHQVSPCVMEVRIGQTRRSLAYPLPVIGSRSKLRIARKSSYVEVVVPIAEPLQPDGFALDRFPIPLTDQVGTPWNLHHLQLDRLPVLDVSNRSRVGWIGSHLALTVTDRERALEERDIRTDTLTNVKATIRAILVGAAGIEQNRARIFGLMNVKRNIDTFVFVPTLRFDLASHTLVADAYVLPLNRNRFKQVEETLMATIGELAQVELWGDEVATWKRLMPALAERCRTWKHGPNCEFLAKKSIPLSLEHENDPLCSCGKGKDVSAAFMKEREWASAAPFVTRIAIGPIFGVPYVESIGGLVDKMSDAEFEERRDRCARCGGPGKPKLLVCGGCKSIKYCSAGCKNEDWKKHKPACKK